MPVYAPKVEATLLNHLHSELLVGPDQVVQIMLAGDAANVFLLDDEGYQLYCTGGDYQHRAGGYMTRSPVVLRPPTAGRWHLVVDLGGDDGQVNAGITIRPA